jgi:hypothetical protein
MKNIAAALVATLALGAGTFAVAAPANAVVRDGAHHARHTGVDGAAHAKREKRG